MNPFEAFLWRCGQARMGHETGIVIEVTSAATKRLEAIVAALGLPQKQFGGRGSFC